MSNTNTSKIVKFIYNDRDWKGGQVVAVIGVNAENGLFVGHDENTKDEQGFPLFLCLAHFGTKATAKKMVEDLNSGKITVSKAIDKVLKAKKRWNDGCFTRRGIAVSPGIGLAQLKWFGASEAQMAANDQNDRDFRANMVEGRRRIEERDQRMAAV